MTGWNEEARLAALREEAVLDTEAEASFETLVQAAARTFGVPIAAISLVDEHRQWFKAKVGIDAQETPRDLAFCAHTITGETVMVVADATADHRFAANALVTGDPAIRFYAGAPIRNEAGLPLGALCVIDTAARPAGLTEDQRHLLQVLADQVAAQLRLRRAALATKASLASSLHRETDLLRVLDSGAVGWWDWDVAQDIVVGNQELAREFGLDPEATSRGISIETFFAAVHADDSPLLTELVTEAVKTGQPFQAEYRIGRGEDVRWVLARGRCRRDAAGQPTRLTGVVINIDDRKRAEAQLRDSDLSRELAMAAARLGRWDHSPATGARYYDLRARNLLGFGPSDPIDLPLTLQNVHPDDREQLGASMAAAMDPERRGWFRESFRICVAGAPARWVTATGRTHFVDGVCTRFMGVLEDTTAAKQIDERRALLASEMRHRMKNSMSLVLSIVDASLRESTDLDTARRSITERLISLSQANDLLNEADWRPASVLAIIERVAQTLSLPAQRLVLQVAPLKLGPRPAVQLALALHELATNSIKYGALSNAAGVVRITCGLAPSDAGDLFSFEWREEGGPPVSPPARRGFGSRLIEHATAMEFAGSSRLDYRPGGVVWSLRAPNDGLETLGVLES